MTVETHGRRSIRLRRAGPSVSGCLIGERRRRVAVAKHSRPRKFQAFQSANPGFPLLITGAQSDPSLRPTLAAPILSATLGDAANHESVTTTDLNLLSRNRLLCLEMNGLLHGNSTVGADPGDFGAATGTCAMQLRAAGFRGAGCFWGKRA